jgi:hypothetical protein
MFQERAMRILIPLAVIALGAGLAACQPTVVEAPANNPPAVIVAPEGPPGPAGAPGAPGEPGAPGGNTTVVVPPPAPAK